MAIDQAGTYMSARHVPLSSFNDVYTRRKAAIFKHTPTHWEYRKRGDDEIEKSISVFTTWEMSLEQLEAHGSERDAVVHLLTLGAFIDTNDIGEGLFAVYAEQKDHPDWLNGFMVDQEWDSDFYQDWIVRLLSVSLVTSIDLASQDARFSFHPLIAEWLKLRIDARERAKYTDEAIRVVRLFVDNGDKNEMPVRYKGETLAHMDKIIEHERTYSFESKLGSHAQSLRDATISFGSFYRRLGRYHETQSLVERAMNDENVSPAIRNILANMYCDSGIFPEAEHLYFKVLTSFKHPLPSPGPNYPLSWTNLAFVYWTQDDKLRSDGLAYEGAYKGDFHEFDPWFVSVLSTFNGLGVLYMKTGRLDLAEMYLRDALAGREKAVAEDERYTSEIVSHLGALLMRTNRLEEAEEHLLRALKYLNIAYTEHLATQLTGNNLGILYMAQNRLDDAERTFRRITTYLEKAWPQHPTTLCAFHNLAILCRRTAREGEAKALLEKTVQGWVDGGDGHDVKMEADSRYILTDLILEVEKEDTGRTRARELFQQAAQLYVQSLGKEHPQTQDAEGRVDAISSEASGDGRGDGAEKAGKGIAGLKLG